MNLADPAILRAFLDRKGLSARKGLGQHFLCSETAVSEILACLDGFDSALEIGPGPGVLTGPLSEKLKEVVALEIDPAMANALKESAPKVKVIREDALRANLPAILEQMPEPRAVVSNLPYYITGALVQSIAEARPYYSKAVLMMQSEVADRYVAKAGDGKRGSISVYLEAFFAIRRVAKVPASAFMPPPKVDSTILEFSPLKGAEYEGAFFEFVRQGFSHPRKTLVNNLSSLVDKAEIVSELLSLGLSATIRPHELSLGHWATLWLRTK